eukprot:COSAG02_NODE_508_length_20916_cov_162.483691_9_plen_64_part_00
MPTASLGSRGIGAARRGACGRNSAPLDQILPLPGINPPRCTPSQRSTRTLQTAENWKENYTGA